jgi:geranylgeranyl diphosphate synthase type II
MDAATRIERTLESAVSSVEQGNCTPRLAAALRHAVFPGGARVRARLCTAVAAACGEDDPACSDAAAAAVELMHCASLVHDDLPCFDDAELRRGKPSVHCAFGEKLAVLAGDALIVLAFDVLAKGSARVPSRLAALVTTLARASGAAGGIAAGQAWECEPQIRLADYHGAKTGALFAAASALGAIAAGRDPSSWSELGARLGEAYQVADDIGDVAAEERELGKPVGRDALLGRPSAVADLGMTGALARFRSLVEQAVLAVPECAGNAQMQSLIRLEAQRLLPADLARRAA